MFKRPQIFKTSRPQ